MCRKPAQGTLDPGHPELTPGISGSAAERTPVGEA
jgi:hypothetical protein